MVFLMSWLPFTQISISYKFQALRFYYFFLQNFSHSLVHWQVNYYSRNCPFQGHSSYCSCESNFHIFPFQSSGTSTGRFHPSSYWLKHILSLLLHALHQGPLPGTMHFTLKIEAERSFKTLYPIAALHGITTQRTSTSILTM